jgi:hypothetical protein
VRDENERTKSDRIQVCNIEQTRLERTRYHLAVQAVSGVQFTDSKTERRLGNRC